MSGAPSKPRKLRSASQSYHADPTFLRSLVSGPPLHEAPTTAVVGETTDKASTAPRETRPGAWDGHLAQLLHSMYLVTFTEKAQLGAMYSRNGGALPGASLLPFPPADGTRCGHSVTVDARWLDAVTRYCHLTATIDDVARVAMVFPALLQVRWAMEETDRRGAGASYLVDATASPDSSPVDCAGPCTGGGAEEGLPSGGRLVARVHLVERHVVSVQEAMAQLKESVSGKGGPAAQRAWRALVNHHTAYTAYVSGFGHDAAAAAAAASVPLATAVTESAVASSAGVPNAATTTAAVARGEGDGGTVQEAELIASLSAELRASLSAPKLQALLRQMRKEASHVEEDEHHRIAQRQLQERLLHAYEHVRALYGPREERGRSALALITAMQQESRFEDVLDIQALLSTLLAIPASGFSATILREGQVVVEAAPPPPSAVVANKPPVTRGKRKRVADEVEAPPPVVVRLSEPFLEPVSSLHGLTEAELDLVLVRLDRAKASVKGVLEATTS